MNPVEPRGIRLDNGGMSLTLSRERMLEGMLAADRAFDGRFITGVITTGIYCLPSCRARKPKPEHVVFHDSPGSAGRRDSGRVGGAGRMTSTWASARTRPRSRR